MLKDVRGMAWDMSHLRLMEQFATAKRHGVLHIPYYVSLDQRWRELLRLDPVRFMLIDDATGAMLSGRSNEDSFQRMLHQSTGDCARSELTPEKREVRREAAGRRLDPERLSALLQAEEKSWLQLAV